MKFPYILAFLLPLILAQSTVTSAVSTACYSTCATCSQNPSNCTSCGSTLALVENQCILDVRDGVNIS